MADENGTAAVEAERPEWLPENFQTPEDFRKSYDESQRMATQASQRAAALEDQLGALTERLQELETQPRQQTQTYDPSSDPMVNMYAQSLGIDPEDAARALGVQIALQQQVAQQAIQQAFQQHQPSQQLDEAQQAQFAWIAEQEVARHYGDEWQTLRDEVASEIEQKPYLVPDTPDPRAAAAAVRDVAEMVRARKLVSAAAQGQGAQAELARQKMLAQGMQGGGARIQNAADTKQALMDRLRAVPTPYGAPVNGS